VKSPHFDALAARGVRFDRAYCQYPLCSPARTSLMTGRRPDELGVFDLTTHFRTRFPDLVTLPQLFRNHGYIAERVGKIFHTGNPGEIGRAGLDDDASWDRAANPKGRDKVEIDAGQFINLTPDRKPLGSAIAYAKTDATDEEMTDGLVAAETIKRLEEHRDHAFFIAAGFYRPHTPFIAPKRYFDLYPIESIPAPPDPTENLKHVPAIAPFTKPAFWGLTTDQQRAVIQAYYASVSFLDAQIGHVLAALERLDLARDTIVVYWSDHGFLLGEHGQWLKYSLFEQSARIPVIISAPGHRQGVTCKRVVEALDIYPTLAELAGLTPREPLSGRSLLPLIKNPEAAWPHAAFTQVGRAESLGHGGCSIRNERWRYSEWGVDGSQGAELYDHDADPLELENLADDPRFKAVRTELHDQLRAMLSTTPGAYDRSAGPTRDG